MTSVRKSYVCHCPKQSHRKVFSGLNDSGKGILLGIVGMKEGGLEADREEIKTFPAGSTTLKKSQRKYINRHAVGRSLVHEQGVSLLLSVGVDLKAGGKDLHPPRGVEATEILAQTWGRGMWGSQLRAQVQWPCCQGFASFSSPTLPLYHLSIALPCTSFPLSHHSPKMLFPLPSLPTNLLLPKPTLIEVFFLFI